MPDSDQVNINDAPSGNGVVITGPYVAFAVFRKDPVGVCVFTRAGVEMSDEDYALFADTLKDLSKEGQGFKQEFQGKPIKDD